MILIEHVMSKSTAVREILHSSLSRIVTVYTYQANMNTFFDSQECTNLDSKLHAYSISSVPIQT